MKGGRYDKEMESVIITGVLEDSPTNSSFTTNALMSISNAPKMLKKSLGLITSRK